MSGKITIAELDSEIKKQVQLYAAGISKEIKAATDEASKELLESIRANAPEREGKYKKAMAVKTIFENPFGKTVTWYVKEPYYRLTHLLEKGHAKRNGGRVRAFPHIEKNAEAVKQKFEKRVEEIIENGGK